VVTDRQTHTETYKPTPVKHTPSLSRGELEDHPLSPDVWISDRCALVLWWGRIDKFDTGRRRLRRPSVDVDAFAISTVCCDLELWGL